MKLIRPDESWACEIAAYRQEFLDAGDSMDGTGALRRMEDMSAYLRQCADMEKPENVPAHLVPATQFLFVDEEDHRLLGMIQVRHRFNDYLSKYAGHIGYSVRPSERRKGYARRMLALALPFCRELGLGKVMVTCDVGNEGSRRTILANGGKYEYTIHEPDDDADIERYWISL